jgi:hypothetical protein
MAQAVGLAPRGAELLLQRARRILKALARERRLARLLRALRQVTPEALAAPLTRSRRILRLPQALALLGAPGFGALKREAARAQLLVEPRRLSVLVRQRAIRLQRPLLGARQRRPRVHQVAPRRSGAVLLRAPRRLLRPKSLLQLIHLHTPALSAGPAAGVRAGTRLGSEAVGAEALLLRELLLARHALARLAQQRLAVRERRPQHLVPLRPLAAGPNRRPLPPAARCRTLLLPQRVGVRRCRFRTLVCRAGLGTRLAALRPRALQSLAQLRVVAQRALQLPR